MVDVGGLVGESVADMVGHDTAVTGLHEIGIIALEVAVAARARSGAVQEHDDITVALVEVVNTVAVCTVGVVALGQQTLLIHVLSRQWSHPQSA